MTDTDVKKGDRFFAMGASVEVKRVSGSGKWADIIVRQPKGAEWNKRQPLPFPKDWEKVEQQPFDSTPDYTIHPGVYWREAVDESGMSQVEVAEKVGISTKHLSQILTCTVMPGVDATLSFARAMDLPPSLMWRLASDHRLALAMGKKDLTSDYL
jgi:plasmid maintenance system antidote protein VapI